MVEVLKRMRRTMRKRVKACGSSERGAAFTTRLQFADTPRLPAKMVKEIETMRKDFCVVPRCILHCATVS